MELTSFVWIVTLGCLSVSMSLKHDGAYPPPCDSNIYCHGELLHTVQSARLFSDSKTFVDMKLKYPPAQVYKNFELFMNQHQRKPDKDSIRKFVSDNFESAGSEFTTWEPSDWHENPAFLKNITDPKLKTWASDIHSFWKELGRKIKDDVKDHPDLYSMIYVSHPVIVPGGRFREFFYWDSYWIMEGLFQSEMYSTVKGMLENFMEMVNRFGYVPNGGRVYFRRSQPPLLIPMVKLYMDKTNDTNFLRKHIPTLDKEFDFWIKNRTMTARHKDKAYRMTRYNVELTGPRPESYWEDYELAEQLSTTAEKDELYFNFKSGAESGWDFSSRWYMPPPGVEGTLSHTRTRDIIPVELNAYIHLNAKLMADFHKKEGQASKVPYYENIANEWKAMLNEVLWDETLGSWFDYDVVHHELRKEFFPSNIIPLWAGAQDSDKVVHRVINYLRNSKALAYPAGVPTSLTYAKQQWDFPNGWAPLQHLVVEALHNSGDEEAKELAFEIAQKWIMANYVAYLQSKPHSMFEKYDVTSIGLPGGGGEYDVVVGFGWTNGVVLNFLNRYGDRLQVPKEFTDSQGNDASLPMFTGLQASVLNALVPIFLHHALAGNRERRDVGRHFQPNESEWDVHVQEKNDVSHPEILHPGLFSELLDSFIKFEVNNHELADYGRRFVIGGTIGIFIAAWIIIGFSLGVIPLQLLLTALFRYSKSKFELVDRDPENTVLNNLTNRVFQSLSRDWTKNV